LRNKLNILYQGLNPVHVFPFKYILQKVSLGKKFYMMYNFFFVRRIIGHLITFMLYCVVIPASVFVPEVDIPDWGVIFVPSIITLLNSVGTPRFLSYFYSSYTIFPRS